MKLAILVQSQAGLLMFTGSEIAEMFTGVFVVAIIIAIVIFGIGFGLGAWLF